ncbi:MAG: putative ion transporter superfamily protein YfcC [Glaciecola sp.]|jgi:uncharacterized ion transporter superfamily protein YfcC
MGHIAKGLDLYELGALFIAWGIFAALVGRLNANEAAERFIEGVKDLASTALLIGIARGIGLIMEDGQILHTLVNAMSKPLSYLGSELAAVAMFYMQTLLNFFIPSGSGQAYLSMPLMAPIGDIVGVNRQISVLAFQMGDGIANIIVPTGPVLMAILGIAGVPYSIWFRYAMPLVLKLSLAASILLVLAVVFDYGGAVQPQLLSVVNVS